MKVIDTKDDQAIGRELFLKENYIKWNQEGGRLRERRLHNGLSLEKMGELLGTSASRIGRLERGLPVSQAKHLKASCDLLFDHIELKAALLDIREKHIFGR